LAVLDGVRTGVNTIMLLQPDTKLGMFVAFAQGSPNPGIEVMQTAVIAAGLQLPAVGLDPGGVAQAIEDHMDPLFGQGRGHGKADAAGGAGDDRHMPGDAIICRHYRLSVGCLRPPRRRSVAGG
jgi:hypothetical protein